MTNTVIEYGLLLLLLAVLALPVIAGRFNPRQPESPEDYPEDE